MAKIAVPSIRFSMREYRIALNRVSLAYLDDPEYIQLSYNDEDKVLAVAASDEGEGDAVLVPKKVYHDTKCGFRITRKELINIFKERAGWSDDENYKIFGRYDDSSNRVLFNLTEAFVLI